MKVIKLPTNTLTLLALMTRRRPLTTSVMRRMEPLGWSNENGSSCANVDAMAEEVENQAGNKIT